MSRKTIYISLSIIIGSVWLVNGLFCKILNMVPRHQEIVGSILGDQFASLITVLIGVGEVILGVLIIVRFKPKLLAITQILLVATMNIIEFIVAPNLLLWGKLNFIFAIGFIFLIYCHEFILKKSLSKF